MTQVFVSSVIDAPLGEVWARVRDFNAMPDWHPAIAESRIENGEPSDRIGCVRNFRLKGGGNIREQLLSLSDVDYSFTYCILESGLPVENYRATLQLMPVTDGNRTYAQWTAEFNCLPAEEENMMQTIGGGVFQAGFNALKAIFAG